MVTMERMTHRIWRYLALGSCASLLVLSVLTGCQSQNNQASDNQSTAATSKPNDETKISTSPSEVQTGVQEASNGDVEKMTAANEAAKSPSKPNDKGADLSDEKSADLVKEGEQLYIKFACNNCHMNPKSAIKAPDLTGIYGKQVKLSNGQTITADDNYIKESIKNPQAKIVSGYMPTMTPYPYLNEEQLDQIVAYIRSLK